MASSAQWPTKLVKQVLVIRKDLGMSLGKACAQAAHASEQCVRSAMSDPDLVTEWDDFGHGKIVLSAKNLKQLIDIYHAVRDVIPHVHLVIDEGRTELPPQTPTVLGIGPWYASDIDVVTKKLQLYT